ncbi:MAG TPA: hypothetical protein VF637_04335 [Sphingomicrobium sp.]|jgi:hypothetical protein
MIECVPDEGGARLTRRTRRALRPAQHISGKAHADDLILMDRALGGGEVRYHGNERDGFSRPAKRINEDEAACRMFRFAVAVGSD